jgi:AraC-like DNA-binding protein
LERFFRTELERSPRNWLEVERLRQAARMLSEGRPQKDIAAALAFSHPSHFIRRFTESYGCAPGAWLRRSRCATPRRTRGAGVPDRSRR